MTILLYSLQNVKSSNPIGCEKNWIVNYDLSSLHRYRPMSWRFIQGIVRPSCQYLGLVVAVRTFPFQWSQFHIRYKSVINTCETQLSASDYSRKSRDCKDQPVINVDGQCTQEHISVRRDLDMSQSGVILGDDSFTSLSPSPTLIGQVRTTWEPYIYLHVYINKPSHISMSLDVLYPFQTDTLGRFDTGYYNVYPRSYFYSIEYLDCAVLSLNHLSLTRSSISIKNG